jgi:hypothetical protein
LIISLLLFSICRQANRHILANRESGANTSGKSGCDAAGQQLPLRSGLLP